VFANATYITKESILNIILSTKQLSSSLTVPLGDSTIILPHFADEKVGMEVKFT
jgi:hypothetical protein